MLYNSLVKQVHFASDFVQVTKNDDQTSNVRNLTDEVQQVPGDLVT